MAEYKATQSTRLMQCRLRHKGTMILQLWSDTPCEDSFSVQEQWHHKKDIQLIILHPGYSADYPKSPPPLF